MFAEIHHEYTLHSYSLRVECIAATFDRMMRLNYDGYNQTISANHVMVASRISNDPSQSVCVGDTPSV